MEVAVRGKSRAGIMLVSLIALGALGSCALWGGLDNPYDREFLAKSYRIEGPYLTGNGACPDFEVFAFRNGEETMVAVEHDFGGAYALECGTYNGWRASVPSVTGAGILAFAIPDAYLLDPYSYYMVEVILSFEGGFPPLGQYFIYLETSCLDLPERPIDDIDQVIR